MLITNLLPLLTRYSLQLDLVASSDGNVTATIIPRRAEGTSNPADADMRPISITATAAEIDAELAKGIEGALGQLVQQRKSLADQIADQAAAAAEAKKKAEEAKKTASKPAAKAAPAPAASASSSAVAPPASLSPPAGATAGEPASLW